VTLPDRAITVRFPWSALILGGQKAIEIRGQHTPHRGALVLHCARGISPEHMEHLRATRPDLYRWVTSPTSPLWRKWPGVTRPEHLAGRAIGLVTVTDCRPADDGDEGAALVRPGLVYAAPWALVLAQPRALPVPVELRGQVAATWRLGDQAEPLWAAVRAARSA
jgi:hypothetical protein